MKAFYDRRMQELENDKKELEKINSSQCEQITELIKRYRVLEEGMKELLKQSKKRS
jgi:predicted transcriptional regulator